MHKILPLLALFTFLPTAFAQEETNAPTPLPKLISQLKEKAFVPLKLELSLADGSRLAGTSPLRDLAVATDYGKAAVPFDRIRSLDIRSGGSNLVALLDNGDRITGAPDLQTVSLDTAFGRLYVGLSAIRRIDIRMENNPGPGLRDGLVLDYGFNRDEGDRATDDSDAGNHGRISGARFNPEGRRGGCLVFDGIDDFVNIATSPSLQLQSNFTLAAWIAPEPASEARFILARTTDPGNQSDRGIEWGIGPDDTMSAYFWNTSSRFFAGGVKEPIHQNEWTHLVLQHDASLAAHQMRAFVNGSPTPLNFGYETISSIPSVRLIDQPWRIGCARPGREHFKGRMDDIMIFNRCVTDAEVKQLYESSR